MRTFTALAVFVGLALVNGCSASEGDPPALHLPEASAVARVQGSTPNRSSYVVSDPEGVAGVLEALESFSTGWEVTMEPIPELEFSAAMSSADNTILFVVWIGDDWLAANGMQGGPNFRQQLVDPERARLLRSFGVELEAAEE